MTISVNDHVLINTTNETSVGKVVTLYDLGDYPDPHRAEIHWLYKYKDLTKKCREKLKKQENELFLPVKYPDKKPIRGSVEVLDAETIIEVIKVILLRPKQNFPMVKKCTDDGPFCVKYAFDDKDNIYYATEYLSKLDAALRGCVDELNNNRCATPKASYSTPKNRIKSSHGKKGHSLL